MTGDPDDNKFVDCAIATEADQIITWDRHFEELEQWGRVYIVDYWDEASPSHQGTP